MLLRLLRGNERRRGRGTWRHLVCRVVWASWGLATMSAAGEATAGAVEAGDDEVRPLQVLRVSSRWLPLGPLGTLILSSSVG